MEVGQNGQLLEITHLEELLEALAIDFGVSPFAVSVTSENVRRAYYRLEKRYPTNMLTLDHRYGITGKREVFVVIANLGRHLNLTKPAVVDRLHRGLQLMQTAINSDWHETIKAIIEKEYVLSPSTVYPSIADLGLRIRTQNSLKNCGLESVPAILNKERRWFKGKRGFGKKTLADLEAGLARHGHSLK